MSHSSRGAFFSTLLLFTLSAAGQVNPSIILTPLSPSVICSDGTDTVRYSVSATDIPPNTNVVIYQSQDSTFNPYNSQGDSIGFIPGNSIPRDTVNFGSCLKTLGIFIDACGAPGQEGRNEYIVLTSGNGIKVSNIAIDFSSQNNSGAANADININNNPCGYKVPSPALIAGLQAGTCNASNVIPASPADSIPANAIILLFTSDSVSANYGIAGLCNLGYPIYVLQSSCLRTIGAFTNAPRCDAPSRYRTTAAIDLRQNCRDNFTYDLCGIFDEDGTYAIRQQGTDTASVANNGIRRNAVDSCGGIDYSQLSFNSDTTLTIVLSNNYCNTGYYYIKAVTNPSGTQPVSNTLFYQLICNDVNAVSATTNICSGDFVIIDITSSNPNADFSWTVQGGADISGEANGTGNSIRQLLTYSGTTKDSLIYTILSTDAGCRETQQVKVVVNNCIQDCRVIIDGNTVLCNDETTVLTATGQFDSVRWSTGATTESITVSEAGVYTVIAFLSACTDETSVEVQKTIVAVQISGNLSVCPDQSVTLDAGADFDSYAWLPGGEQTQTISVSLPGKYVVTVTQNDCSAKDSVNVIQLALPEPFSIGNDTAYCGDFSRILFTGVQSTQWSTQQTGPQITVTSGGTYIATISNTCGAETASVTISQNDLPQVNLGNDTAICDTELQLEVNNEFEVIEWNTGSQSSSISVAEEGVYFVQVTDNNGCKGSDTIVISSNCSADLFVPNAFSPNGDGVNDVFMVRGNARNTVIDKMIIYNRWGNKVFEASNFLPNDISAGWDGNFKGTYAQADVYGYYVVAKFNDGTQKILKGNVTLLK
jgi:gliding motility-associated-like protein